VQELSGFRAGLRSLAGLLRKTPASRKFLKQTRFLPGIESTI
jgi:hypothetical protein